MQTQIFKKIILISLTLVGCARVQEDESLVQKDLSFSNFKVFTNTEMTKEESEQSVFTPPFSDETLNGEGDNNWIMRLFDWVPDGAYTSRISSACHFSQGEKILLQPNATVQKQGEAFQKWLTKCEPELSRHNNNKFKVLLDFATAKYSLIENKQLSKVKIDLTNGYIVRGILGLKRDGQKRPLILVQSGVHNNASDGPSARNIIMQLFDEAPFNILFIGSVTGKEFLIDNGVMTLGGVDEGRNLIEIAQMIKKQAPFADLVSEIHVLGVSLGGHGALYSSLYNSYLEEKPIESVMAYCPVNNLSPTLDSVFDESIRGWYYNMLTVKLVKEVFNYVPMLGQILEWGGSWSRHVMKAAVQEASFRHYRAISQYNEWTYPPFDKIKIEKKEDLWNISQFVDQIDHISTPTMVAYSGDDYLVLPKINSNVLLEKLKNSPRTNIGVIKYEKGNHCAASLSSGWPTVSSMFRTYFLGRSKNVEGLNDSTEINLKSFLNYSRAPLNQTLKRDSVISMLKFEALKKKNYVRLGLTIFDPDNGDRFCRTYNPVNAPLRCFKNESVNIPIKTFASVGVREPASDFEKQYLTRWMNTHVEILDSNKENLLGHRDWPIYFKVNGRYEY